MVAGLLFIGFGFLDDALFVLIGVLSEFPRFVGFLFLHNI
jgi:hypothetical protein